MRNKIRLMLKRHPYEYRSRWPDLEMFKLRPRDVVFDVGANVGDFTECVLAYQPWARVHSFEPLPQAFAAFVERLGKYPGVYPNNLALGTRKCVGSLNVSNYDQASSFLPNGPVLRKGVYGIDFTVAESIPVCMDTLAGYANEHRIQEIKLLKLDVQGYEIEVLRGAEPVLSGIDFIYTEAQFQELYVGRPSYADIFEYLKSKNFELLRMTSFRCDDEGKLMECDMVFRNRTHETHTGGSRH